MTSLQLTSSSKKAIFMGLLMRKAISYLGLFFCLLSSMSAVSCGYGFRSSHNIWEKEQIHTLYIEPLRNNTLHPGVETMFTSALLKEFSQGGRIKLVSNEDRADAVLSGSVDQVISRPGASTTADQVAPGKGLDPTYIVAREYSATGGINLRLTKKSNSKTLWGQGVARTRVYPGENNGGDIGNTGDLINESRFLLALQEIANAIAIEAHDLFFEGF